MKMTFYTDEQIEQDTQIIKNIKQDDIIGMSGRSGYYPLKAYDAFMEILQNDMKVSCCDGMSYSRVQALVVSSLHDQIPGWPGLSDNGNKDIKSFSE